MEQNYHRISRRQLLQNALVGLASLPFAKAAAAMYNPVESSHARLFVQDWAMETDKALNAIIPRGASLRVVASSGQAVTRASEYMWHSAPDGGACFETDDGGWVYVSNSEMNDKQGGAGAIAFAADGEITTAYSILSGTTRNCAGGKTLWGTWLSCEENGDAGQVYECDPLGKKPAQVRPALGNFNHEAAAMDPATGFVYLTEDDPAGALYRFRPSRLGKLDKGTLEVAVSRGMHVDWQPVPDPSANTQPLRQQVKNAAKFQGGEGIVYGNGHIYFTTKYDNKVWALDLKAMQLTVVYDASLSRTPVLTGVDNIEISHDGSLLIAEDGGDMQIVALATDGRPVPLVTLLGQEQSEITGPAFSPDGTRLYFSSQRGPQGMSDKGLTYELILPA